MHDCRTSERVWWAMRPFDGDWCLSGGAPGADLEWGLWAASKGHGVTHFSFVGHNTAAPDGQLVRLTEKQLKEADPHCRRANQTLGRKLPPRSQHSANLLRRDWYQARYAKSCYGVDTFGLPADTKLFSGAIVQGKVKGGTAWA